MTQGRAIALSELERHVGEELFRSPYMAIDDEHLGQFAFSTYLDPTYTDLTASKNNPLGATLIDGFLLLSMLTAFQFNNSPLAETGVYGFNYGLERVRFTRPVFLGENIRCVATLAEAEERPDGTWRVVTDNVIEVEGSDKPAMVARWVCLYATREDREDVS